MVMVSNVQPEKGRHGGEGQSGELKAISPVVDPLGSARGICRRHNQHPEGMPECWMLRSRRDRIFKYSPQPRCRYPDFVGAPQPGANGWHPCGMLFTGIQLDTGFGRFYFDSVLYDSL